MRLENWPAGTRVRLKVATIGGWKGTATMLRNGRAIKDGGTDPFWDVIDACPWEWSKMRDQTPNFYHREFVELDNHPLLGAKGKTATGDPLGTATGRPQPEEAR